MEGTVKKASMLLKSLIFHYHGMEEEERELLVHAATQSGAIAEMEWANDFVSNDYLSAFERARAFLSKVFLELPARERLAHLEEIWEESQEKGFVTEMEITAMLTLSQDWLVERDFLKIMKR